MRNISRSFASLVAIAIMAVSAPGAQAQSAPAAKKLKSEYRFVMIPILAQAWFDIVHTAAVQAADDLGRSMGTKITIDYQAPAQADLVEQNSLLERAIATNPDGIAIDANDVQASLPILKEAQGRGIPVVLFVSTAPEGSQLTYISNDFYQQGLIEGTELLKKIHNKGNVAILQGVPTNSAHADRYRALTELFKRYPRRQGRRHRVRLGRCRKSADRGQPDPRRAPGSRRLCGGRRGGSGRVGLGAARG